MNTLSFLFCTLLSLLMKLVGYVVAPFLAVLSVYQRVEHLPVCFSWFDTLDNTLDGDVGLYPWFPAEGWGWRRVARRTCWLCRNCAYGFSQTELAVQLLQSDSVEVYGDATIENRPAGKSGWFVCIIRAPDGVLRTWGAMLVYQWPGTKRCLRAYLGWKIKPEAEKRQVRAAVARMFVFSINPFMGFIEK